MAGLNRLTNGWRPATIKSTRALRRRGVAVSSRCQWLDKITSTASDLVGLLRAYLNRGDLLHDLDEQASQLRQAFTRGEPPVARSVSTVAPGFRQRRLADRLNDTQVQAIISAFEAGTPRWQLAEQHKISVRSVGRLLRRWRAERDDVA